MRHRAIEVSQYVCRDNRVDEWYDFDMSSNTDGMLQVSELDLSQHVRCSELLYPFEEMLRVCRTEFQEMNLVIFAGICNGHWYIWESRWSNKSWWW